MSATVEAEPLSTLRLPSGTGGLCVALVTVAVVVFSADLARFLTLLVDGRRAALVSFSSAARFFFAMTTGRGTRSASNPPGAGADLAVFWPLFGALIACFGVVIAAIARSLRNTTLSADGFASRAELAAVASLAATKRSAVITRPSLEEADRTKEALGYPLGMSLRPPGVELVASWETSTLLVAPPGAGKTLRVLSRILRQHPGPCLATATKPDLYEVSALARERVGPVFALDPDGLAPAAEPLCWSPVLGCTDSAVAERRAGALVAAAGEAADLRSASFFRRSATTVLAAYLHAAALEGGTIADVLNWAARPSDPAPLRILAEHAGGQIDWGARLHRHTSGAEETTSGVMRSVDLALSPFHHEDVLSACAVSGENSFDIARALASPTTIYALGKDRGASSGGAGPLITAFCDELVAEAEREAALRPARRLDPPLLALLDEAPSIVPLPGLPALVADGRGRGIATVLSMQSFSQAIERWGQNGAQTIRNASSVTAVFGGLSLAQDLEELSRLSGSRRVQRRSVNEEGSGRRAGVSTSSVEERVLTPAQIRTLKDGELLLFWGRLAPVLAYAPGTWEGKDAAQIAKDEISARQRNDQKRGEKK